MNDLHLFRLLSQKDFKAAELPELLGELATSQPTARAAFLGLLGPLLEGETGAVEVRRAAHACLVGCEGSAAVQAALRGLSDEDEQVRACSLTFFQFIAQKQPWRWVHVAFHPEESIRRASFDAGVPAQAAALNFALFADPACRDLARERFLPGHAIERWMLPAHAPAMILDFVDAGLLTPAEARLFIAELKPEALVNLLAQGTSRSASAAEKWLQIAGQAPDVPAHKDQEKDEFDRIFDLLWLPKASPEEQQSLQAFFGRLATSQLLQNEDFRRRCAASLIRKITQTNETPINALELLVELYPTALTFAWIPKNQRRDALRVFYRRGEGTRKEAPGVVENLIESDLAAHRDGRLDLWAIGAILHTAPGAPFELLFRWVSVGSVLEVLCARMDESMPFLSLSDASSKGTAFLLEKLRKRIPERSAWVTAVWSLSAPIEHLEALTIKPKPDEPKKKVRGARKPAPPPPKEPPPPEKISPGEAIAIFQALLNAERQGHWIIPRRAERLAALLGSLIGQNLGSLQDFFRVWLEGAPEEPPDLGVKVLVCLAQPMDADAFGKLLSGLELQVLRALLSAFTYCVSLSFSKERALAQNLIHHTDEQVRTWARARIPVEEAKAPPPSNDGTPLSNQERTELEACTEAELPARLKALGLRRSGVTAALAARTGFLNEEICASLLCCDDPVSEVDLALDRFGSPEASFQQKLHVKMVELANSAAALPALAHAWLVLWERHAFALLAQLTRGVSSLEEGLAGYLGVVNTPWIRLKLIEAVGRLLGLLSYRDTEQLGRICTEGLLLLLLSELPRAAGYAAAEALVLMVRTPVLRAQVSALRPQVQALLPDLTETVRQRLAGWIDATGLPPAPVVRKVTPPPQIYSLSEIRTCNDLDRLEALARTGAHQVQEEVALRLLDFGEPGLERTRRLLLSIDERHRLLPFLALLEYWPDGPARRQLRAALAGPEPLKPEVRFAIALALAAGGDASAWDQVFLAVGERDQSWFTVEDWDELEKKYANKLELAHHLAGSPQPHAYCKAITILLEQKDPEAEPLVEEGLLTFLAKGTLRLLSLRVRAARWLCSRGHWQVLPVLLRDLAEFGSQETLPLLSAAPASVIEAYTQSTLLLGGSSREQSLLSLLEGTPSGTRGEALEQLIAHCQGDDVRRAAVRLVKERPHRAEKLNKIAETFAWGTLRGRELLGGLYKVEMVEGSALGYTRLNEKRIFVSPLPILRRERNGRELVEALILHELGHHRYHRGEVADNCWKASEKEGIQRLYNLVLDEQLERNLRAIDESFGDRLKLLTAYAFQHSNREVSVASLLESTGIKAAQVLPTTRLRVARAPDAVIIESGSLLLALERDGLSFSRFLRALRMGLGNRQKDPRVEEALALFSKSFRRSTPEQMLEVARSLKKIFGGECRLLECTGSHETLSDTSESIANSDAISSQEVDEEVERVLDPKRRPKSTSEGEDGKKKLWININPSVEFDRINAVTKLNYDRSAAERLAQQVRRQAFHLRRFLENLGLARVPERRRIQGHRFDATRVQALLLRNDPRVLIARRVEQRNDVFLGVVVDCSGSMQCGGRIERARLFAALIAEAVRGLQGVSLRLFGFTDQVIYDAGDANTCSAHELNAGGGNNDAAALWHAAQVAQRSQRKSRVLVMISDGLPTECSAAALKNLTEQLARRARMVCAQVAVAPITEPCFAHYVLLNESNQDEAVRRFGALIGTLVRRSMSP